MGLFLFAGISKAQTPELSMLKAFDKAAYYWTDEKPSLNAHNIYKDIKGFKAVRTKRKIMKREIDDGVEVMIEYAILENASGQKVFKEITVYYVDLCEHCDMKVKFSGEQFHRRKIPQSNSYVIIGFTLNQPDENSGIKKDFVTATLSANGEFSMKVNDV